MKTKIEMIESTAWLGKFVAFHELGEYSIIEYKPKKHTNTGLITWETFETESDYKPFINGKDTNRSYDSIESAIIAAIAIKYDGCNTRADEYFMKAIK